MDKKVVSKVSFPISGQIYKELVRIRRWSDHKLRTKNAIKYLQRSDLLLTFGLLFSALICSLVLLVAWVFACFVCFFEGICALICYFELG